jgi:tetratricopeptide (TPR) repeat protein
MKRQLFYILILFQIPLILNAQQSDSLRLRDLIDSAKKDLYTNTDKSEKNFRIALRDVRLQNNKKWESDILNQLGVIYYKKSQFDSALVFYKKSYDISKKLKDTLQLAINYSNVANILRAKDQPDLAIANYLKALPIYEKKGKILHQAMTFGAIGTLHLSLDQFDEALVYFRKTNVILKKIGNKQGIVTTELNIAICLEKSHKIEAAKTLLKKVISDCKTNNYQRNHSIALSKLGKIYLLEKDYLNAKKYYQTALTEFKKSNDIGGLAETSLFLGDINYLEKTYNKALNHYKNSLKNNQKQGVNKKSPRALEGIIKSLKKLNRSKETIAYYDLLLEAKDTVFNIERRKIATEINTKYDVSQKEKALKIKQLEIEKKNVQLTKQKQFGFALAALIVLLLGLLFFVRKANKFKRLNAYNIIKKDKLAMEQNVLLNQMNPHFIFNALNSIQSYVSENDNTNATLYLAKFSRLIRLILENSRKKFVPFKEELFALDAYLKLEQTRFDNSFDYQIDYPNDIEAVNLPPMLIQPFVENAIKHGISTLKKKGHILIEFQIAEAIKDADYGILICTIADNGIGLKRASEKSKSSLITHKSMSLDLVKNRLINYSSDANKTYNYTITSDMKSKGTIATITLPYTL